MNPIDKFLNDITAYRLVLYGLLTIVGIAFILSALNILGYSVISLAGSAATLATTGFVSHFILVRLFKSAPSVESWIITSMILFLILKPAQSINEYAVLGLAGVLAMASKYIFTFGNRHLFNPVAITLVILGLLGSTEIFWWVGSKYLLPIVLIAGLLIVRKLRRFDMVLTFTLVALAAHVLSRGFSSNTLGLLQTIILSGPIVFFAVFMLTEPQSSPQIRKFRIPFTVLVGILFGAQFKLGPLYSSPELALVVGNLFAFVVSYKRRLRLELNSVESQGPGIYELSFTPDHPLKFKPGQYMEWTLPHKHTDSRGDRRYFTIASAPSEQDIKLVARIGSEHSSSFKKALLALQPGDEMWVSQLGGDFTLPRNPSKKLVLIAGGIGITPFRSIAQELIGKNDQRDAILFYTSLTADGFIYSQLFNQATRHGLKPNYIITGDTIPEDWTGKTGFLTEDIIRNEVPDYKERVFYLSGPNAMVVNYKRILLKAGVPQHHIKTDYFPGY